MTGNDNHDRDREFSRRLSSDPGLVALAATATGGAYGETNGLLFARRYLERELGAGPSGLGEWVYREAASGLRFSGCAAEAHVLMRIADTSSVLAEASIRWAARYAARPVTAAERESLRLIEDKAVRPVTGPDGEAEGGLGADGARYTPAVATSGEGERIPAVIVTTHAGTAEMVTGFSRDFGRDDWLADRLAPAPLPSALPPRPVPLRSSSDGPACRTAREELALAWLLTGDPGNTRAQVLGERSFTACSRAEIYLAWRDAAGRTPLKPALADVRDALACRMLRAPGWAAPITGWPFGHRALAYFDRITATPVSDLQGRAACRDLVHEDAEAIRAARAADPARRPGRPAWHPSYGPRLEVPAQRRPEDPAPGFGPHL